VSVGYEELLAREDEASQFIAWLCDHMDAALGTSLEP
jgi:hypothetical protein